MCPTTRLGERPVPNTATAPSVLRGEAITHAGVNSGSQTQKARFRRRRPRATRLAALCVPVGTSEALLANTSGSLPSPCLQCGSTHQRLLVAGMASFLPAEECEWELG